VPHASNHPKPFEIEAPDGERTRYRSPLTPHDYRNAVWSRCARHRHSLRRSALKIQAGDDSATNSTDRSREARAPGMPSAARALEGSVGVSPQPMSVQAPQGRAQRGRAQRGPVSHWKQPATQRRSRLAGIPSAKSRRVPTPPTSCSNIAHSPGLRSDRRGSADVPRLRYWAWADRGPWTGSGIPGSGCCPDRTPWAAARVRHQRTIHRRHPSCPRTISPGWHSREPTSSRPMSAPRPGQSAVLAHTKRRSNGVWIYREQTYSSSSPGSGDPPASGSRSRRVSAHNPGELGRPHHSSHENNTDLFEQTRFQHL
jgi:hypothetical protein